MQDKPTLARITIYPIKSLDGISLSEASVVEGGCLAHDREFAIIDANDEFINGKANPLVHTLRSKVDFHRHLVSFRREDEATWQSFDLENDAAAINMYLSKHFNMGARLVHDSTGRFLDIPDTAGLTVLSTASIEAVAQWFGKMDIEETRRRFRATIEIAGVNAFWEDNLFAEPETAVEFKIGDVTAFGMSPRARCSVPPRNPFTGDNTFGFSRTFAQHRVKELPKWSKLEYFEHGYYLSVNTLIPPSEIGKTVRVGDEIAIIGTRIPAI